MNKGTEDTNGTMTQENFGKAGGNLPELTLVEEILKNKSDESLIWTDKFIEGFARAITKSPEGIRYFFIDERTGKIAFNEKKFIFANHFKNGQAEITIEKGKNGTINKYGKIELFSKKKR